MSNIYNQEEKKSSWIPSSFYILSKKYKVFTKKIEDKECHTIYIGDTKSSFSLYGKDLIKLANGRSLLRIKHFDKNGDPRIYKTYEKNSDEQIAEQERKFKEFSVGKPNAESMRDSFVVKGLKHKLTAQELIGIFDGILSKDIYKINNFIYKILVNNLN